MPFRCNTCQHLSRTDDNPECKNRKQCSFRRVAVIHFVHPYGIGKVVGSGVRTVMDEDKAVLVPAELKLFCGSEEPLLRKTPARHAATCLDCLENSAKPEPQIPEVLPQTPEVQIPEVPVPEVQEPQEPAS